MLVSRLLMQCRGQYLQLATP